MPLPVAVDPRLLLRKLESLITCAIRQTPTGGRILLQASREGAEAKLTVHRSGPPIPADEREGLFDKFQATSNKGPRLSGWGLGLYFCRLSAQAHHAKLAMESSDGWASSYVLRMSLLSESAEEHAAGPSACDPASTGVLLPASASALLSTRRTPSTPKTQAALAEFARALAPLEGQLGKARVC
jgi:hypothetical protein